MYVSILFVGTVMDTLLCVTTASQLASPPAALPLDIVSRQHITVDLGNVIYLLSLRDRLWCCIIKSGGSTNILVRTSILK